MLRVEVVVGAAFCGLLGTLPLRAQSPVAPEPLAVVAGVPITVDDFHPVIKSQIQDAEQQVFEMRRQAVEEIVRQRLLTLEANKLGLTIEQLIAERVDRFVVEPTSKEVDDYYEQNKENAPPAPVDELKRSIHTHLATERRIALLRQLIEKLKTEYRVTVNLTPPRYTVTDEGPVRGSTSAPVTIVVFSDFQCLPCALAQRTVARLFDEFPSQLKLVYRFFPIDSANPRARPAALAAACAARQGRFWEYHDRLYEQQGRLSPDDLVAHARDLKLDFEAFRTCMNGREAAETVARDVEAGQRLGVNAAPAYFINGRPILGSAPIDRFREMILEEVRRFSAVPGAPPPGVVPPTSKPPGVKPPPH